MVRNEKEMSVTEHRLHDGDLRTWLHLMLIHNLTDTPKLGSIISILTDVDGFSNYQASK